LQAPGSAVASATGRTADDTPPVLYRGETHRAFKHYAGTTHRVCSPEETLERIEPILPMAGITRMADVTGLDRIGIPTILAMRPNAPTLANSSGKGFTLAAAKVSAAMEGIELFCAEEEGHFPFEAIHATHAELEQDGLAAPAELLPLAKWSLFHRETLETWVIGFDILGQREVAVPYEVVGMGSAYLRGHWAFKRYSFQVGSNGLASGNVWLEAVCAGLAEVIERDAVACTMLRHRGYASALPRVDLSTIPYDSVQSLVERLRGTGILPILLDCTVDTEVPTFVAYLLDEKIPSSGVFRGYGTHLHPEVAMVRALTEAVQGRCVYIAGSRDDMATLEHLRLRSARHASLFDVARTGGGVDASSISTEATSTFEGDCHALLRAVSRVGLEHVVVVNLTWPELGMPVVRVVVPGLEGYSAFRHYAPGPRGRAAIEQAKLAAAAGEARDGSV
jgi:ribosomal protein S12 methylthiotransferase accessory factor